MLESQRLKSWTFQKSDFHINVAESEAARQTSQTKTTRKKLTLVKKKKETRLDLCWMTNGS